MFVVETVGVKQASVRGWPSQIWPLPDSRRCEVKLLNFELRPYQRLRGTFTTPAMSFLLPACEGSSDDKSH